MSEVLAQSAGLPRGQSSAGVATSGAGPHIAVNVPFIELLAAARAGPPHDGAIQSPQAALPQPSGDPAGEQFQAAPVADDLLNRRESLPGEAAIIPPGEGQSAATGFRPSQPQPGAAPSPPAGAAGEQVQTANRHTSWLPKALGVQAEFTGGHQNLVPEPLAEGPARDAPPTPAIPATPLPAASALPLSGVTEHARMSARLETDRRTEFRATAPANTASFEQQQASGQERIAGFDILQRQPGAMGEVPIHDKSLLPDAPPERLLVAAAALGEPGDDPLLPFRPGASASLPPPAAAMPDAQPAGARGLIPAVAAEIVSQLRGGKRQFEIRLDPPELGRIEVKLEFRADGGLAAKLVVDRPETLDLLMRDARGLERTLQAGGFKLDDGALEYQLRDQPGNEHHEQRQSGAGEAHSRDNDTPEEAQPQDRRRVMVGGLDIRV